MSANVRTTPERRSPRPRRNRHYENLLHQLNQRYHREFLRAERLARDLAWLERLRATWLFRAGRYLVNLFRRCIARPPRDAKVTPLALEPVGPTGRVSIIIPFRDQAALLRDCLTSLRTSSYRNYEIILVDNGSHEPALLRLLARLEHRRRYRILRDDRPFNFSALCNHAATAARGDWLLFLNNDTRVLTPDWLEQLLTVAQQPKVGIVGATLLYPDQTIQHAGMIQRADGVWVHLNHKQTFCNAIPGVVLSVPAVSAACMLINRELFFSLGGFDESRPIVHNDVDLCRRARVQGHTIVVTPHARLLHYESLSRGYALTPADASA